jgi:hypothetical protein
VEEQGNGGDDQQKVNEPSCGVKGKQPEGPAQREDDK